MRRAPFAHVLRCFLQRPRPITIPRTCILPVAGRTQSSNQSSEYRTKRRKKIYDPTGARFNESEGWGDFLLNGTEVVKDDEAVADRQSGPDAVAKSQHHENRTIGAPDEKPTLFEAPGGSQTLNTQPTEQSRRATHPDYGTVTMEEGERISKQPEENHVEEYLIYPTLYSGDMPLASNDNQPVKFRSNPAIGADELAANDGADISQLLTGKSQPNHQELLHRQYRVSQSKRNPKPETTSQLRNHSLRTYLLFGENQVQLSKEAIIPPEEISIEDELVPLARMPNTVQFQRMYPDWYWNYATLFAKNLHASSTIELVIISQSRQKFAETVRSFRAGWLINGDETWQLAGQRFVESQPYETIEDWADFMLLTMRYMPNLTAGALQASYAHLTPPFYMVADIIHFIARFGMEIENHTEGAQIQTQKSSKLKPADLVELVLDIIPQCTHGSRFILHSTTVRLLDQIDLRYGYALFNGLRAFDTQISPSSCLAFARFFGKNGEYETAISALDMYLELGGSTSDFRFKLVAAGILRWSITYPQGHHDSGFIVSQFMEMGLEIGRFMQNTLIANSFDSKDTPTALDIFTLMRDQGVEPNAITYGSLLKGLRNCDDDELVDEILGLAWAKVEETKNEWLAAEVMYWHFAQHMRRASNTWDKDEKDRIHFEALQQLVMLFTRLFDRKPLDVLGFPHLEFAEHRSSATSLNIKPTSIAMNIMLLAYTRVKGHQTKHDDVNLASLKAGSNARLYERWWLIATRWDLYPGIDQWIKELFVDMMKTRYSFNMFMHALGVHVDTLYSGVTILQHMEKMSVSITKASGEGHLDEPIAAPDLFSWSILLNAFARHGHVEAAEKCLELMKSKGFRPDASAWNTVIKAYAVKQRPDGVVNALRRKEKAGFGMDDGVIRTLSRVRDQESLKALLQTEVRSHDAGNAVLGREGTSGRVLDKWNPDVDKVVTYQPGIGSRQVQYFDANRSTGLHKESWTVTEEGENYGRVGFSPIVNAQGLSNRPILRDMGSFSLKSENEEDWFEDDEIEDSLFEMSPMKDPDTTQK